MSKIYAEQLNKKKREEEKKVVGQQQKTQPTANKPTGTTSIPKDTSRAQSSAASSRAKNLDTSGRATSAKEQARKDRAKGYVERHPSARNYTNDTRTRRSDFRTTKQINEMGRLTTPFQQNKKESQNPFKFEPQQKHDRETESLSKNGQELFGSNGQTIGGGTINRLPSAEDFPEAPGSGINQIDGLNKYILNGQFDENSGMIDSHERAEKELENILYNRDAIREENRKDAGVFNSLVSGIGYKALDTLGNMASLGEKMTTRNPLSTEGMTPDEIYNRAMESGNKINPLNYNANDIAGDYNAYKEYVLSQMESGAVTPDEIQKMKNLETQYSKIPAKRLKEMGLNAQAVNEGLSEGHPIANVVGQMVPMIAGNALIGQTGVVDDLVNAASGINNPATRFAATQAANLIPDLIVDTAPEALENIAQGKSAGEVGADAVKNIAINELANLGFEYGPQFLKGMANKINSSNIAKKTAENVIPEVDNAISNVAKQADDIAEQTAKNAVPEVTEQVNSFRQNIREGAEKLRRVNVVMDAEKNDAFKQYGNLQEVDPALLLDNEGQISELLKAHPEVDIVRTVPFKDKTVLDDESKNLMEQIKQFKADKDTRNFSLDIGEPSEILKQYGVGNKRLHMDLGNAEKALTAPGELPKKIKHPHDIGTGAFEALPEKLDKPLAIIKSVNENDGNCVVILTDMATKSGDPVNIALRINKNGKVRIDNKLTSVYGRGKIEYYLKKEMDEGNVLYYDYSQTKSALDKAHSRVQSPTGTSNALNVGAVDQAAPSNFNVSEGIDDVNARDIGANADETIQNIGKNTVPGNEVLPDANTNVPKVETGNSDNPKLDRGPEERLVDTNDVKERGYARSTRNNADVPDELAADFVDKPELYNVLHNSTTREKSNAVLAQGFDKAYNDFKDMLNKKDPAAIPVGYDLAKQMIDNGDTDGASELIRDMARELTKAGQFSQAAAMTIMRGDPMTALRYAEKEIDSLNTAGLERFGKKWKEFELTPDEVEAFSNIDAGDEDAIKALYDRIGERIGKEYPTSTLEKLLEARRIGMLFNPRTNVRNLAANVPTLALRWTSDRLDAVGQNITHLINPEFEVTQSIRGSGKKGRELAKQVFESDKVKALLEGTSGKYKDASITGSILKEKQMYKGTAFDKWVNRVTHNGLQRLNEKAFGKKGVESIPETLRNATYKALDLGDSPFVKENFIERLGSYIRAQKYTSIDEIPDEAIETAWEAAMKATYKDESWAYKLIRDVKGALTNNGGKVGKTVGESLIPFVQAPGNIAARMIEYSPVGGINGIKTIIKGAKEGSEKAVREGINELAQGATGTLALGIGIALYNSGIISGAYSSDKDKRAYEKSHGYREYALHIGDGYYTLDWAQPAFQTIMNGVILADAIKKSDEYDSEILKYFGKEGSTAGKIIGATKKGVSTSINSWFNASPLQSMQDLLGGTYEDANDIASKLWEVGVEDFVGSYIPSSVNALAKTVDTTQRQTTDPSNKVASFVNQQVAKVPYASKNLPAKYDTWGREMKYADSKGKAFFNRFVNPGEGTKENKEAIDHELDRIFDVTDDNAIYPQEAPKKVDGNPLTARQFSELQKNMGERSYDMANTLLKLEGYKEFNDEEKAKEYANIYSVAKWAAQLEQFEPDMYNFLKKGDETVWNDLSDSNKADHKAYLLGGAEGYLDHRIYSHELSTRNISASEKTDEIWNSDLSLKEKKTQLDDYANYKSILKENDATDSEEARDIYYLEGEDALKEYLNKKKVFKDIGAPNTDNADALYSEGRIEELKEYTKYYNAAKDEDTLTVTNKGVVESLSEASPEDQKKYTEMLISSPAKGAEDAAKHYENGMYQYYKYKMDADLNGDGKTTNEEITDFLKDVKNLPEADKAYWDKTLRGAKTSIFDGTAKTKKKSSEKASQTGSTNVNKKVSLSQNSTTNSIPDLGWSVSNGKKTFDLHDAKGYKKATKAGISDDEWLNAYWAANTNKDHHITAAEAKAYISALEDISQTEKHDWFDYLIGTKAKNPY